MFCCRKIPILYLVQKIFTKKIFAKHRIVCDGKERWKGERNMEKL